jgi:hypothetical protein
VNKSVVRRHRDRGCRLSTCAASVLLLVAVLLAPFAAGAGAAPTRVGSVAHPVSADDGPRPAPAASGALRGGLPDPAVFRGCLTSISRVAGCLGTAAYAACGTSFSRFMACMGKAYGAYTTTRKIQAFRASSACPQDLPTVIAEYLCSPRVPQAPRSVTVAVGNAGHPLAAYTGPSTFYPSPGTYASGTRLPVVCVASAGQMMNQAGRSSTYWSRLGNGLFMPWVGLVQVGPPGSVPFC